MQCVILAAGKGTRLKPLTDNIPKPLVKICGEPILKYIVLSLPEVVDEIILVVNYLEEQIRAYCGNNFCGRKVKYVTQENPAGGTGEALRSALPLLKDEKFLFMYADDIHGKEALEEVVQRPYAILAATSETPEKFGVLSLNKDGTLKEIKEKPKNPTTNLINIGGMVMDKSIFSYQVKRSESGELYLTDMISVFAKERKVDVVPQDLWIPIGYPEDIEKAEAIICPDFKK